LCNIIDNAASDRIDEVFSLPFYVGNDMRFLLVFHDRSGLGADITFLNNVGHVHFSGDPIGKVTRPSGGKHEPTSGCNKGPLLGHLFHVSCPGTSQKNIVPREGEGEFGG
jgi:hypothetical protein